MFAAITFAASLAGPSTFAILHGKRICGSGLICPAPDDPGAQLSIPLPKLLRGAGLVWAGVSSVEDRLEVFCTWDTESRNMNPSAGVRVVERDDLLNRCPMLISGYNAEPQTPGAE